MAAHAFIARAARASISFNFLAYHEKWRRITRGKEGRSKEERRKETFSGAVRMGSIFATIPLRSVGSDYI